MNGTLLFGPIGPEMIVILGVLVLLFGANKIPKLARSAGQATNEFKKGREELEEDITEIEENVGDLTDRRGRYSLYKQIERQVDREVTSPILQNARRYGREYVGDRVSDIRAADGTWAGDTYRTGLTTDNEVVLAHEYGSGQYGSGNGPYKITPGGDNEALSFEVNGYPVAVEYVVHPGVQVGRRHYGSADPRNDTVLADVLGLCGLTHVS